MFVDKCISSVNSKSILITIKLLI